MCGISGYYSPSADGTEDAHALVREVVASQHLRGPDHHEIAQMPGPGVTLLGHNRLSIIDLSSAANQPMWDAERSHCIVFNGEIYNYLELRAELASRGHAFRTRSDTEVLIEAFKEWGCETFGRLNGMFALAIFRVADSRLWLVRDRFGVKPLYYRVEGGRLWFASTPGVIARSRGAGPNLTYAARGLRYWLYEDDTEISPYTGVPALCAGHYLEVSADESRTAVEVRQRRYYDVEARVEALREELSSGSLPDLTERVRCLLSSAVELRLRADVPVGISLSGGLDSATIAAMLADLHPSPVGFSFSSPEDPVSEGPLVRELEKTLGIQVHYIRPTPEAIAQNFEACLAAQDAPFPNASVVAQYMVCREAHEQGIKVLLGGQGGDEGFMGYRKFYLFHVRELARTKDAIRFLAASVSLLRMSMADLRRPTAYLRARHRYTRGTGIQVSLRLPEPSSEGFGLGNSADLWRRQALDVTRYSLPTLLRYEDRNSMGSSVETRLPFLDYRLVELGLALPTALKLRNGYGKWIVRQVMRGRLPESIVAGRYKRGFSVSEAPWAASGIGGHIREAIRQRRDRLRDVLPDDVDIDEAYSDQRLRPNEPGLAEAVTLIWLAGRL